MSEFSLGFVITAGNDGLDKKYLYLGFEINKNVLFLAKIFDMSIFSRFSFFKTPKHKKFDPVPRFYDQQKEYIEEKMRRIKSLNDEDKQQQYDRIRSNIRSSFRENRNGFGFNRRQRRQSYASNIRLVVILIFIIIITYILLTRYFSDIEELLR